MTVDKLTIKRCDRPVSLRDVARAAGVDVSTVSRTFNDGGGVSVEKAQEIRHIACSLGYRPRPIRTNRARAVGLVLCTNMAGPDNPYLSQMLMETESLLTERNLNLNVAIARSDEPSDKTIGFVEANRVDGVLLVGHPSLELVEQIRRFQMPVVGINDSPQRLGVSCACSDPGSATSDAVLRLAAWGHNRIGMVIQKSEYPSNQLRLTGYHQGLANAMIQLDPSLILEGFEGELQGGRQAIDRYVEQGDCPTAIFFENDWMAVGAIEQLRAHGLNVPADVSVIGYGDLWICQQHHPALSSIHRSARELLTRAVEQLLLEIETGQCRKQQCLIDCQMQWRDSTAVALKR